MAQLVLLWCLVDMLNKVRVSYCLRSLGCLKCTQVSVQNFILTSNKQCAINLVDSFIVDNCSFWCVNLEPTSSSRLARALSHMGNFPENFHNTSVICNWLTAVTQNYYTSVNALLVSRPCFIQDSLSLPNNELPAFPLQINRKEKKSKRDTSILFFSNICDYNQLRFGCSGAY